MNQRRKQTDLAKDAEPGEKTMILKLAAAEEPTQALDARATLMLKGEEAERMKEATQAQPPQLPSTTEATVALHALPASAEQTVRIPAGQLLIPTKNQAEATTVKVRQEDIAWVAGESPESPGTDLSTMGMADPTSRMKVSFADLSRIVKQKESEAAATVPAPAAPNLPEAATITTADSTFRLSRTEMDRALEGREEGTGMVPVIQAAEQTLILKPDSSGAPTSRLALLQAAREEGEATRPVDRASIASTPGNGEAPFAAEQTLIVKPSEDDGATAPVQAMAAWEGSAAKQVAPEATPPEAASTLVLKFDSEVGTHPISKPVLEQDSSGTLILKADAEVGTVPIIKPAPAPEPAPSTMLMPKVEATPAPEPIPSTMVMPKVEATPAPEPAPSTMLMPKVEATPAPEPAPSTVLMPKVEATPAPESAPSTVLMPKVEAMPVQSKPESTAGTVPVVRPSPSPEPAPPTRPLTVAPMAQRTLLVPVEELSRLTEIPAATSLAPVAEPFTPAQEVATAYSTQRMPTQGAAPWPQVPPADISSSATPPPRPLEGRPAATGTGFTAPAPAKGTGKLWVGLAGLGLVAAAGAVLWLKPALLGLGGDRGGRSLPAAGSSLPGRELPASLKGIKEKAEAGDASSMRYLGTCFANGLGVPRDVEEAKRWFRRAAEAGSQAAREELAILQRQEK